MKLIFILKFSSLSWRKSSRRRLESVFEANRSPVSLFVTIRVVLSSRCCGDRDRRPVTSPSYCVPCWMLLAQPARCVVVLCRLRATKRIPRSSNRGIERPSQKVPSISLHQRFVSFEDDRKRSRPRWPCRVQTQVRCF
jgi:hypothetical protein